jgi:hypothetical protein
MAEMVAPVIVAIFCVLRFFFFVVFSCFRFRRSVAPFPILCDRDLKVPGAVTLVTVTHFQVVAV